MLELGNPPNFISFLSFPHFLFPYSKFLGRRSFIPMSFLHSLLHVYAFSTELVTSLKHFCARCCLDDASPSKTEIAEFISLV